MQSPEQKSFDSEVKALLEGFWPLLFSYRAPRPLKVGIIEDMVSDSASRGLPFDKELLKKALLRYTWRYRYQEGLAKGENRYDLDGNEAGIITPEQRERALRELEKRTKNADKQKRLRREQKQKENYESL